MLETLKISREGGVVLVQINRPKQLNALNEKLLEEVLAELIPLDKDPSVGCFVLTGNEKAFAAGADIKEMEGKSYADMVSKDYFAEWDIFTAFRTP